MEEYQKWLIGAACVLATAPLLWRAAKPLFPRSAQKLVNFQMSLLSKNNLNHNTIVFKFSVPKDWRLPVGQHVAISMSTPDGKVISRAYTPIAVGSGWVDLLIKIYRPTERFPQGGALSQYLNSLAIGAVIEAKGPVGRLQYLGNGRFFYEGSERVFKKVGMIAGGTGITPMWQIMQAARNEDMEIGLLFGNQSPSDILMREDLVDMKERSSINVAFTVDRIGEDEWDGLVGFVDREKIQATLPPPGDDVIVIICGPPAMNTMCKTLLGELGYSHVFSM